MTTTVLIVGVFVIGYLFIAIESLTKVNKAAIALLMFVACWTIFMLNPGQYIPLPDGDGVASAVSEVIEKHLGSTSTTLFFLMGAMTIVELVDQNGGFNFVRGMMKTKSKRTLLWRIAFMTFFLSAILDNLTTSIVMIMILRKLVSDHKDRIIYASLVVIAANSGGAFSPIGDVTTIMLWNKGVITAAGVIKEIFIPSLISMVIPALIMSTSLNGELSMTGQETAATAQSDFTSAQRKAVFAIGVGGLMFVPVSPSGTGKTLSSFISLVFSASAASAQRIISLNKAASIYSLNAIAPPGGIRVIISVKKHGVNKNIDALYGNARRLADLIADFLYNTAAHGGDIYVLIDTDMQLKRDAAVLVEVGKNAL